MTSVGESDKPGPLVVESRRVGAQVDPRGSHGNQCCLSPTAVLSPARRVLEMPARLQHQWGLVGGVASAFLFRAASQCLARWPSFYPGRVRREGSEYRCWRYRNFSISLLHALLTGLCSLCM